MKSEIQFPCVNGYGKCDVAEFEFYMASRCIIPWPCDTCRKALRYEKEKEGKTCGGAAISTSRNST